MNQGTRQGGVSSPMLYLVYIDGLLKELQNSKLGFCIYDYNYASPTVADDMCLVAYSKSSLDQMLNICHNYSRQWRYDYNASKCAVIVFNESARDYKYQNRIWRLGNELIPETTEYTHLGIALNKYMNISSCITNANSKLRSTFFSTISNGIYEDGTHPITSLKIYKSVVLPKALYGCELWNDISKTQLVKLERSHKFCIKYIQSIDRTTRSDIAMSLLGCKSLESEIDFKKLTLLGQLCHLSSDFLSKDIFNNRLIRFIDNPHNKYGFFPDLYRILQKYDLVNFLSNYVTYGIFPTKYHWKTVIRDSIERICSLNINTRMESDSKLQIYSLYNNNYFRCSPLWLFCKKHPKMLNECQSTIKILSKLYSHEYTKICFRCGIHTCILSTNVL